MTVIKYQTKTQYKFSVCIFLPSLQSVVCILYQVCSLHSAFCTDRTGIAVFVRNKNKSGKQRLFFQNCDFITQYLLIKKQETQKRSHNHLNKSVTKHLSTVTFLTFFVEACRYVGKTLPLEFNLQYRRHLNNNANKYLDSDNAFSYSSQLAEKKSFFFTMVYKRLLFTYFLFFVREKEPIQCSSGHQLSSLVASCKMEKTPSS